jgi:predicted RNase H-related nuclease YkuK (DUF458 family)
MDKAVVFGSRKLFGKLCKNRLTGKVREGLKKQRQETLISIGSKSDRGNRSTRFEDLAEGLKTGELLSYQTISLHHLLGLSQNSKNHTKVFRTAS